VLHPANSGELGLDPVVAPPPKRSIRSHLVGHSTQADSTSEKPANWHGQNVCATSSGDRCIEHARAGRLIEPTNVAANDCHVMSPVFM